MSIQSQYLYRPYTKEEIEKDLIGAQLPQTLPPIERNKKGKIKSLEPKDLDKVAKKKQDEYVRARRKGETEPHIELAYCDIDGQLSARCSTIAFLAEKNGIELKSRLSFTREEETVTIAIDRKRKTKKKLKIDAEAEIEIDQNPDIDKKDKERLLLKLQSPYITEKEEQVLMVQQVLVETQAFSLDGKVAYGGAVTARQSSPYFVTTAHAKSQRQAMEQLIPENEIKYAFWQTDGAIESGKSRTLMHHYQRCLELKEEIDETMSLVNHFTFWQWVTSLYTKPQLKKLDLVEINSWSLFEQDEQEACKLAAWLNYYKDSNDDLPF